jgi:diguanylate cyclase (GGDEF)-like protein
MYRLKLGGKLSPLANVRTWPLWSAPSAMRYAVLSVDALTCVIAAYIVAVTNPTSSAVGRWLLLVGLALAFEEVSTRVQRLRVRLASYSHVDLTSVWTFAGVVVLPTGLAILLVIAICGYMWFRHERSTGMRAYRQVYGAAAVILACLAGRAVLTSGPHFFAQPPSPASAIVVVAAAMAAYQIVNLAVVLSAIYLAVRPVAFRSLLQTWNEVSLEIATLCLGGLAGLALLYQPWLTVLVLPPMVVLQRSTLTKELEVAATTDSKTGLLNAITWQQLAQREIARAEREDQSAALLIIDMDNFKLINDRHGHLVGDAVLRAVADCLRDELRGYDSVGRFGGEEFVALLSDSDALTAVAVSDRILARVRQLEVATRDENAEPVKGLSASIGIACYPQQGNEVEDLLHAADAALYTAKNAGRDRVELDAKSF